MIKKLLILVLLFVGCREETDFISEKCQFVTISDGLPVQFWLAECQSYNLQQVCGIYHRCFCQPFNCDDEIKTQLFEVDAIANNYSLVIYDEFGNEIIREPFSSSQISDPDPEIEALSDYENYGSGEDWTISSNPTSDPIDFGQSTKTLLGEILNGAANFEYSFAVDLDFTRSTPGSGGWNVRPTFYIYSSDFNNVLTLDLQGQGDGGVGNNVFVDGSGGPHNRTFTIVGTPDFTPAYFGLKFAQTGGLSTPIIVDINSLVLTTNFEPTVYNTLTHSFIPSDFDICNQKIQLKIITGDDLENGGFAGTLDPWENYGAQTQSWAFDSGTAEVTTPSNFTTTKGLRQDFTPSYNTEYTFSLNFDITDGGAGAGAATQFIIYFFEEGNPVPIANTGLSSLLDLGTGQSVDLYITGPSGASFFAIYVNNNSATSFGRVINLNSVSVSPGSVEVAYSDCLDIKTAHECTNLIKYSNSRNYAGLIYTDVSPEQDFYIRVPSVFFHDRFPKTQEVIELGSQVIGISSAVKHQRSFETDYLPYYMHLKLNIVLSHQNLLIVGKYWTLEEEYEIIESDNKRSPIKMARTYLTNRDYVRRNVL